MPRQSSCPGKGKWDAEDLKGVSKSLRAIDRPYFPGRPGRRCPGPAPSALVKYIFWLGYASPSE
jgi:hypothetical protein